LRAVGADVPAIPGTAGSSLEPLHELFGQAGLVNIDTLTFEVTVSFPDFDAFWLAQTPSYNPTTRMITAMPDAQRSRLKQAVMEALPFLPDGTLAYSVRANAIKALAPRKR
jgi:hypothetical protein